MFLKQENFTRRNLLNISVSMFLKKQYFSVTSTFQGIMRVPSIFSTLVQQKFNIIQQNSCLAQNAIYVHFYSRINFAQTNVCSNFHSTRIYATKKKRRILLPAKKIAARTAKFSALCHCVSSQPKIKLA